MTSAAFAISPPALYGLGPLATFLKGMKDRGEIEDWHPGPYEPGSKKGIVNILFDNREDAARAHLAWLTAEF
jgi:hypothetical protein